MHISEKIVEYFAKNGWIYASTSEGVVATKTINFQKLAGQLSNGDRLVKIKMDVSGRWLEMVDGWDRPIADIDLRNYWEKTAHEAVSDLIKKLIPCDFLLTTGLCVIMLSHQQRR